MPESASIQIILNAHGNLGQVVDAASGKILNMARAAKGSGDAVRREAQQASGAVAAFGEQSAKAFGGASSAVAKFAGPLGLLGGAAAVAGFAINKALDSVIDTFRELNEQPILLRAAIDKAAEAARELSKVRDAAIIGNVGKVAGAAEPLVARGGDAMLALARQISTDTGVDLDAVSKAVQAGSDAQLGDEAIRRLVQGAHLAARSGRMSFDEAVSAGVANRVDAGFAPSEVAADMVNRQAFLAHQATATDERRRQLLAHQQQQDAARAEHESRRRADFDRAQLAWNLDGQRGDPPQMGPEFQPAPFRSTVRFRPAVTAADFAAAEANLAASPVAAAVQAKREMDTATADQSLRDIAESGRSVIMKAAGAARVESRNPGLAKFMEEDRKLAQAVEAAEYRANRQSWFGALIGTDETKVMRKAAEERKRHTDAFILANPDAWYGRASSGSETVDEFNARTNAERDTLERTRREQGIPFGDGLSRVEALLEKIATSTDEAARNTARGTPAPLTEAQ